MKTKKIKLFSKRNNYNNSKTIYYKSHCNSCCVKKTTEWAKKNPQKANKNSTLYQRKIKLAKELRQKDLESLGWRRVAVWGYYRDLAEQKIKEEQRRLNIFKSGFKTHYIK